MSAKNIEVTFKNNVRTIKINRPEKRNAITSSMYRELTQVLNADALDNSIVVTILTGVGNYFSSGNDVTAVLEETGSPSDRLMNVKNMITAFINYPKLLIAVVNGPAIGIGATCIALCDIIYASDNASFDTPFLKLGICAEGGSSFIFPYTLGRSKASEMIFLNHKMSAQEAYNFGLIAEIIPQNQINKFIEDLHKYGELPVESVKRNKKLLTDNLNKNLLESNDREFEMLAVCAESPEFSNAILAFMNRKSKL